MQFMGGVAQDCELRRIVEPDLVDILLVEVFSTGVALSIRLLIRFSILRSKVLA